MSDVRKWLCGLGKEYSSYADILSKFDVQDLPTLASFEVDKMVNVLGFKKIHAEVIYRMCRKDISNDGLQAELVAPKDYEKVDFHKINLFHEELKNIFTCKDGFFTDLIKLAKYSSINSIVTEALDLLHRQQDYITELKMKPLEMKYWGFLSHVQTHSTDLCCAI